MTAPGRRYTHLELGFRLRLPASVQLIEDPRPGVPLIVLAPTGPTPSPGAAAAQRFRANLVVTVAALPAGLDVHRWQHECEPVVAAQLRDYRLIDTRRTGLAGRPAQTRLAHHTVDPATAVTMTQWAVIDRQRGWTLTGTAPTLDAAAHAEWFIEVADSFELASS